MNRIEKRLQEKILTIRAELDTIWDNGPVRTEAERLARDFDWDLKSIRLSYYQQLVDLCKLYEGCLMELWSEI